MPAEVLKLSKYLTVQEAIESPTALKKGVTNIPPAEVLEAMKKVGIAIFDPMREHFGKPVSINSFYRSPQVNVLVGGSTTSDHTKGFAIDIDNDKIGSPTNAQIFEFYKARMKALQIDQLIWEFGDKTSPSWVHVSHRPGGENRGKILRASKNNLGNTVYTEI